MSYMLVQIMLHFSKNTKFINYTWGRLSTQNKR